VTNTSGFSFTSLKPEETIPRRMALTIRWCDSGEMTARVFEESRYWNVRKAEKSVPSAKSVVTRSDEHPTSSPARRLNNRIGFMRHRGSQSALPDRLFRVAAKGRAQFGFLRVDEHDVMLALQLGQVVRSSFAPVEVSNFQTVRLAIIEVFLSQAGVGVVTPAHI
jgi:hypothetical protein